MAIWQFRLTLVPASEIQCRYANMPNVIPPEDAEDFPWWNKTQPHANFEDQIDKILPEIKSWSFGMRIWGDERSNTATVCYNDDNNKIEWIGFRIDIRAISEEYITAICAVAQDLECIFITGTYHLLVPKVEAVLDAIGHSTAKKYIEDPVATLRDLNGEKAE